MTFTHWCYECGTQWWEDFEGIDAPILESLHNFWCQVAIAALLKWGGARIEVDAPREYLEWLLWRTVQQT